MKIISISIRGYRTIREELKFDIDRMITLVGPNNSGKTNTLRALHSFFTGYDNDLGYSIASDTCHGEKSLRTNVQITIGSLDVVEDADLIEIISQVRNHLGLPAENIKDITLYLTFSPNSNPAYRVFPNSKRPSKSDGAIYSRLERKLFDYVLGKFSIHYIPSEKSVGDLYKSLVLPHLFKKMYNQIQNHIPAVELSLNGVATELNSFLNDCGLGDFQASFEIPKNPDDLFRSLGFNLKDEIRTSVFQKGMGIQSAVLLASFCWIAKQEKAAGKLSVWLLEEPESYLHPELATQCQNLRNV